METGVAYKKTRNSMMLVVCSTCQFSNSIDTASFTSCTTEIKKSENAARYLPEAYSALLEEYRGDNGAAAPTSAAITS